ncbi:MAG: DUF2723 domain-containing protein [FCB group bacterium]|nr:DUF2723 domain-containing protein [FCB group bacterium]
MENRLISRIKDLDRPSSIMAGLVLIFTFVIYNATKAPTLSFWDCGEFIACSYSLGIPHPPGTPLYILIGRIFSIIPFHADISARVNMLSAVTGGLAAMMAFIITLKLIRYWWPSEKFTGWRKIIAFIGATVGAMMFAFSRTHWNNTLEAEVYTPAMLTAMVIFYLMLRWVDSRHESSSDRYLVVITYLGFLSIGIHLTTFMFMPVVFLVVILFSERLRRDVRFYITGLCMVLITYDLIYFLWAMAIWLVILLAGLIIRRRYLWKFSLALLLAAILGLSCQLFTPIRSAQQPVINQNNPSSSTAAFLNFMERKQYGNESMITRAFSRRGEWKNQLGTHQRMGFWGFFQNQYGINGRYFAFLFVLGLLGLFELARRNPRIGWAFILMVLLGTVFLVWYMNFADGTHQDQVTGQGHIEVRDRDYFFTPGFIFFGIAIGLGAAALMEMARDSLLARFKALHKPVMITFSAVILLAAVPLWANYRECDNSKNYVPFDFAYNMLISCEPNAILFNGGDNDTFPIWCLQTVYGVRPDVTAINLSLANTTWYLKQIRDRMGVPLRWTDGQIDALRHRMTSERRMYRIQEQALGEMLAVNQWQRPINFSQTIPGGSKQYQGRSLASKMTLRGMVHKLYPGERPGAIDLAVSHDLYWYHFRYRSIADTTINLDPRSKSLSRNYTTGLVLMADSLKKVGRMEEAVAEVKKAIEIVPTEYATYKFLTQLYVDAGIDSLVPDLISAVPPEIKRDIYYVWAASNRQSGNREKAKDIYRMTLDAYPTHREAYREYAYLLYEDRDIDQLFETLTAWVQANPDDDNSSKMLKEITLQRALQLQPIEDEAQEE